MNTTQNSAMNLFAVLGGKPVDAVFAMNIKQKIELAWNQIIDFQQWKSFFHQVQMLGWTAIQFSWVADQFIKQHKWNTWKPADWFSIPQPIIYDSFIYNSLDSTQKKELQRFYLPNSYKIVWAEPFAAAYLTPVKEPTPIQSIKPTKYSSPQNELSDDTKNLIQLTKETITLKQANDEMILLHKKEVAHLKAIIHELKIKANKHQSFIEKICQNLTNQMNHEELSTLIIEYIEYIEYIESS